MFVNYDTNQYVMFNNKKSKIGEVRNNLTRFYESPLSTNMEFPLKNKRLFKSSISTQTHFGFNDKKIHLADLEVKKAKLEKLIDNIRKSIQNNKPNDL